MKTRMLSLILLFPLVVPSLVLAQIPDSLTVGQRIRVRTTASSRNTNVFIGNLAALTPDTLTIEMPGGKGTVLLPRVAISEVALSDGHESRWRNLPMFAPAILSTVLVATLPAPRGPRAHLLEAERVAVLGSEGFLFYRIFGRTPPERWRPVYSWLDRP